MSGKQRAAAVAGLAAACLLAGVIALRNLACRPSQGPPLEAAKERQWALPFQCGACGHEFVGYEVSLAPGTTPRDGKLRYRRPGDGEWVPASDAGAVARIKRVVCPKCGADMRQLAIQDGKMPGEGP